MTSTSVIKRIPDLLLVVFVHGFKGTDETFGEFPNRLQHILAETTSDVSVECVVFPAYEVLKIIYRFTKARSETNFTCMKIRPKATW